MSSNKLPHLHRAIEALEGEILRFDRSRSPLVLFAALSALLLLLLAPTAWNSNEEEYFQVAHRLVAPGDFTGHHAAFDNSYAQFVSKGLFGFLVDNLGYERAHDIARIGMAFAYAIGLTLFFSAAEIGALDALLIIAVFCLFDEQLIGGEWLFHGVEHKTLAYALLFGAFGRALKERWSAAILLGGAATYMHFLTGGFWSGMLVGLQWYRGGAKHPPLRSALMYCALVAPLAVIIAFDQFGGSATPVDGAPSADVIYSALRNPHHVAPFLSTGVFLAWTPGIAATSCILGMFALLHRHRLTNLVGDAALGGALFLVIAFAVSYFDRRNYFFGKFYLFRPSSLTLFFALTAIVLLLRRSLREQARLVWTLAGASVIACFTFSALKSQIGAALRPDSLPYTQSLVNAIEANSRSTDVVLLQPYKEMLTEYVRLHRDIPRPTLVSWKMVPANRAQILRWYSLNQSREKFFAGGCASGIAMEPKPALLVLFTAEAAERMRECGPVIWRDGDVSLVKVAAE